MVGCGELTEEAWGVIAPLLPSSSGRRGGQWRDHRTVINGILWKLRTGAPWRDVPVRYGPRGKPVQIGSIAGVAAGPGISSWCMPRRGRVP
jgi:transposase